MGVLVWEEADSLESMGAVDVVTDVGAAFEGRAVRAQWAKPGGILAGLVGTRDNWCRW